MNTFIKASCLILITFVLLGYNLKSASLEFVSKDEHVVKEITDDPIRSYAAVKNITSSDIHVKTKVTFLKWAEQLTMSFCDSSGCYFVGDTVFETNGSYKLGPGGTSANTFHLEVYPNGQGGQTIVKVQFLNADNKDDFIEYTATFDIGPTLVDDGPMAGYYISEIWPNPADNNVSFNYYLPNFQNNSDIRIYNSAGNLVREMPFTPTNDKFNIDISAFSPGTYFMMFNDARKSYTRKFVIMR